MPVGTRGTVKLLDADDLEQLRPDLVLANAYHLMLRPGADVVADLGGLPGFTGWPGLFLTDSGGYQVFSLGATVDDDGVNFRSVYDGSKHRLTPEEAVGVQELLGGDIQMVLDVCCGLPAPPAEVQLAAERTLAWADRARQVHSRVDQSLFGIVQGGVDPALRARCAAATAAMNFDGYAIGGLSVGEPRHQMLPALAAALAELPEDRPRYLMGVGDPVSIVEAVALGVDMFDCVLPTRMARHGTALTDGGRIQVRSAARARDPGPVEAGCRCQVCRRYSVGYLRHLFVVGEPTAGRLLTVHNLWWMMSFFQKIRESICAGGFEQLRTQVGATWGTEPLS
jgi:queuine tRNA-ribosyltransferase